MLMFLNAGSLKEKEEKDACYSETARREQTYKSLSKTPLAAKERP